MLTKERKDELIARIKRIQKEGERRQDEARARIKACEGFPADDGDSPALDRVGGREAFFARMVAAGARWPAGPLEWKVIRGLEYPDIPGKPTRDIDHDIACYLCYARAITDFADAIEARALVCEILHLHPKCEVVNVMLALFAMAYFLRVAEPKALNLPPRPWPGVIGHRPPKQKMGEPRVKASRRLHAVR